MSPFIGASNGTDVQIADRRCWLAVAILGLVGAGLVLLSTARYGAGISPDSVTYLDVARNLVAGRGFVYHTGKPLVWYPPLYPMLLALIGFVTRLDPAAFAHLVNAVLFVLVIYLSAHLLRTGPRQSVVYIILGLCAVLFGRPLSVIYAMAWSECLFIPLVLVYLIFAQRYWGSGGRLSLAVMTVSTALACLTRYNGLALVPAGVLTIILTSGVRVKARFTRAILFAAFSLAPLGLWAVRNYRLTGTLFGSRGPLQKALADNVITSARAMLSWYVPWYGMKFIVLAGIAIALAGIITSRAVRERALSIPKAVLTDRPPVVLFIVAFVVALLMAAMRDAAVEPRTLSPVYLPVTLVLMKLGSYLFGPTQSRTTALVSRAPVILLALWLCFPLTSAVSLTAHRFKDGAGQYSTRSWRESETIAYARQLFAAGGLKRAVYSNDDVALWELAGVNAAFAPRRTYLGSTKPANQLDDLIGSWPPEGEADLIWFADVKRDYLFSVEEIREVANVVEVACLSDGAVFHVSARVTAPRNTSHGGTVPSGQPKPSVPSRGVRENMR